MKIWALLWSESCILIGIMRNLDLLLNDGNLDPFTFWKAVHFENVGHFFVFPFLYLYLDLILQWIFWKLQRHTVTSNSYETITLLGSIKEWLACMFMIMQGKVEKLISNSLFVVKTKPFLKNVCSSKAKILT